MNPSDPENQNQRLVLGTAQLGLDYGIANQNGKPDQAAAGRIIGQAWESGIRIFDTAQGYGDSEAVLGRVMAELGVSDQAGIITKLHPEVDLADSKVLRRSIRKSLERLGVESLAGLLLHSEDQLDFWSPRVEQNFREILDQGLVSHLGISVYSPVRALQALSMDLMTMVQLPANILDRRFEQAGVFAAAHKWGKTILIRSVFLQGLLLMEPDRLPEGMAFARPALDRVSGLAEKSGLDRKELALGHVKFRYPEALVVFGAERPVQVRENAEVWQGLTRESGPWEKNVFSGRVRERVVNPSLWPA